MTKIVCFGDSITEMGTVLELRGYVAQLADRYVRRADVLARGFSGYTSREARQILDQAVLAENPEFVILFFGANDSVLPGQIQHVPLPEFIQNLKDMASRIASAGAWLVLVTPPPVDEHQVKSRTNDNTRAYTQACIGVGAEMNVPVVNLFESLQKRPNWQKACLLDGLHLAAPGMDCLYDELSLTIDRMKPIDRFARLEFNGI